MCPDIRALPYVYERMVALSPLTVVMLFVVAGLAVSFVIKRTQLWKRWRSRFTDERRNNINNNKDRANFKKKVEGFLWSTDEESGKRLLLQNTFKWLRKYVIRSSLDVLFFILTHPDIVNRKEALEEYVKHHRLKDSMGRLATVVWIVGGLAYLVFPDSLWAAEASLAVLNVLPIYIATMFVMDQLDEAREEVFREFAQLIRPDVGSVAAHQPR